MELTRSSAITNEVQVTAPQAERSAVVPARPALDGLVIAGFDLVAVAVAAVAFGSFSFGTMATLAILLVLYGINGTYRRPRVALTALGDMKATVITAATPLLVVGTAAGFGWATSHTARVAASIIPAIALGRVASYRVIRTARKFGLFIQPAVIVGNCSLNERLIHSFGAKSELGLRIVGFVDDDPGMSSVPWLGKIDDLDRVLQAQHVRRLVVGFSASPDSAVVPSLRELRTRPLEVFVVPRLYEWGSASGDMRTQDCAGTPIVWLPHREWRWEQLALKRASDIAMAGVILLLASPAMIVAAALVKMTSEGPVFFRQKRVGKDGVVFEMLKFRSMRPARPGDELRQSGGGDPRVTKVGRLLRRLSLDELPQLFNVLKGDMSMVGPRPEQPQFVAECGETVPGYRDRHRLQVGLTGWAQINQLRGVGTSLEERARYDNYYIEHWSMWRDLATVIRTAAAAVRGS